LIEDKRNAVYRDVFFPLIINFFMEGGGAGSAAFKQQMFHVHKKNGCPVRCRAQKIEERIPQETNSWRK
jgi:hypothetical protein